MAKIYKTSDRIKINVGELVITISPLTLLQKSEVQDEILKGGAQAAMRGAATAMMHAIKDISGVEDSTGAPYELEFSGNSLSQNCIDDLLNLEHGSELIAICLEMINGIPQEFTNPKTGKPLDNVSIIEEDKHPEKKSKIRGF